MQIMTEIATRPPSPERLQQAPEMVGLQGRLVLANQEFLNPQKDCTQEDVTRTTPFEQRNYQPFEQASVGDRKKYWQEHNPDGNFDSRYQTWTTGLTQSLNRNNIMLQTLSPLLQQAGIQTDTQNFEFTREHAGLLYNRYFAKRPANEQKGVNRFVHDVLVTYQTNGVTDHEKIAQNKEAITWFATIFGKDAKDMVTQLILAETKLKTDPTFQQQLVHTRHDTRENKDVMRINDLTDEEKRILQFITQARDQEEQTQRQQPRETQEETGIPRDLPIMRYEQEIKEKIGNEDTVIIVGGTGSGKTLKTPQFIRDIMQPGDKLIITQPRQINTSELATTVAEEAGVVVGEEIGYHHGGDRKESPRTNTLFTTEGTLILQILNDPLLSNVTHVMVDEVHVRSTDTEELLGYLKQAQKLRRERGMKPLKIIAASATVNKEELRDYFDGAEIVDVEGRTFPIDTRFSTETIPSDQMPQKAADIVEKLVQEGQKGDIEIFVAGTSDIDRHIQAILAKRLPNLQIIPLHAGSTEEEKSEVGKLAIPGTKRVFVATNFGETGLTIKGLKVVINTGEEFEETVDPISGLTYLKKIPQARAGAGQRSGRVGRTQPGIVYNLFTEANFNARPEYPTAEIKRTDLTDLVLKMKKRGIQNINEFQVLSSPLDQRRVDFANESLQKLGALNPDGTLNRMGQRMVELPTDFHYARMIAEAERQRKGVEDMCAIVAMSETRSIFGRNRARVDATLSQYKNPNSDFLTRLNIWRAFEENGKQEAWANEHGLIYQALLKVDEDRNRLLGRSQARGAQRATDEELEQFVVAGLKHKLMRYNPTRGSYIWERTNVDNFNLRIERSSALGGTTPEYIVSGRNSVIEIGNPRPVYLLDCQRVKPEWVR